MISHRLFPRVRFGLAVCGGLFSRRSSTRTGLYAVQLEQGWASPGSDPVVHSVPFIVK